MMERGWGKKRKFHFKNPLYPLKNGRKGGKGGYDLHNFCCSVTSSRSVHKLSHPCFGGRSQTKLFFSSVPALTSGICVDCVNSKNFILFPIEPNRLTRDWTESNTSMCSVTSVWEADAKHRCVGGGPRDGIEAQLEQAGANHSGRIESND